MSSLWNDRFATGDSLVDHQHQALFDVMEAFAEAAASGAGAARIGETLAFLERYVREHFATEEFLMAQAGSPERAAHQLEHTRLLQKVRYIRDLHGQDPALVPAEGMAAFLSQWLQSHILDWDLRLFEHIRSRGA